MMHCLIKCIIKLHYALVCQRTDRIQGNWKKNKKNVSLYSQFGDRRFGMFLNALPILSHVHGRSRSSALGYLAATRSFVCLISRVVAATLLVLWEYIEVIINRKKIRNRGNFIREMVVQKYLTPGCLLHLSSFGVEQSLITNERNFLKSSYEIFL